MPFRNAQNLDMTIKRVGDGWKYPTVRIWADPDDTPRLQELFIEHARQLGKHDDGTRWMDRYEARIVVVARRSKEVLLLGVAGDH